MPKEEKHLKPLQIIRNERRNRQGQEVPASVHFQVIGNGAVGGPKSLFLYSDHNRYLFNCGEGTQRLCTEHAGSKTLAQLSNIFITRRTWANLGGLPGMCLSIRASGAPDVTIHGPDGCMRMYEATKHFVVMHDFALLSHRAEDGVFEDAGVSVQHVPFSPKNMPKVLPTDPKYPPWEQLPVPTKWTNSPPQNYSPPRPSSSHAAPSSLEAIDQSVTAYIVTFKPRVGKLDVKRCIELGVPPGPVMGLLKKGQDITLDNGRVVRSWDVVGQPDKPCTYVILECPTSEYVDSLLEDTRLQSNSSGNSGLIGNSNNRLDKGFSFCFRTRKHPRHFPLHSSRSC
jgi:ribonuclease Z